MTADLQTLTKYFKQAYGEGREDFRRADHVARRARGEEEEQPRIRGMAASNATIARMADLLQVSTPEHRLAREEMGLGLAPTPMTRAAQMAGTIAGDITQDRSREFWWLLNAVQAVTKEGQDALLKAQVPELYRKSQYLNKDGNPIPVSKQGFHEIAQQEGLVNSAGTLKAGVGKQKMDGVEYYTKRNYAPGHVDSLAIPVGIATNAGIGLLNPFGGNEGYKAVFESDEDPSKTDNVIGEVAAKYILGRTGNLLNWDDFKEQRPDVSKGEYNAYKAFKFDKEGDMDLSDGDFTVPTGIIKGTMDGIHGPEVQFLGRSLPLTTAGIPIATSLIGTTLGARMGQRRFGNAIGGGLAGGMASLVAGTVAGNLIEQERRNRNMRENFPKSEAVVPELR